MQLKPYQQNALDRLEAFLQASRFHGPQAAYEAITAEAPDIAKYRTHYTLLPGLKKVPYACLRLPTGGGKTLLACHAIRTAATAYMEKDYPVVLWLVPSNTIRTQTVDALKNPRHAYRRAIDDNFGDNVRVFDIADFTQIRPKDMLESVCVIVGTIQTLRVSSTEGRKVYADNENLEPHFAQYPAQMSGLEINQEGPRKGLVRNSLANLLHIHQPLMIIDEAHNAVTGLTREVQERIRPACVIEFTATPQRDSNTIFSVSAAELKAADMIKLPVQLTEHSSWEQAVNGAVIEQQRLANYAAKDTAYIRPIVLFQAEAEGREVTVDVLKAHLIANENVTEDRIAIATGDQRELDGINLFERDCNIEFVITKQALKEGWDCSFAYVFCSVANISSSDAVEQLLGRVLRMPYAQRRVQTELNQAYAHVAATSFASAAKTLRDKMVQTMGFEDSEADDAVVAPPSLPLEGGAPLFRQPEPVRVVLDEAPDLKLLSDDVRASLTLRTLASGQTEIILAVDAPAQATAEIEKALPKLAMAKAWRLEAERQQMRNEGLKSPSMRGERLSVPQLYLSEQGYLSLIEPGALEYFADFNLAACDASLPEFNILETANSFTIDLHGEQLHYEQSDLSFRQYVLDVMSDDWDINGLARWLDSNIEHRSIAQVQFLEFCRKAVDGLVNGRKLSLIRLIRHKHPLAEAIKAKAKAHRLVARKQGWQQLLFPQNEILVPVEASFKKAFDFDPAIYPKRSDYQGSYRFRKHFYPVPGELEPKGEEFECAQSIDRLDGVKYWVRNLERQPDHSFWLPTSTDRFYPDFVALLEDGRVMVIEYKGKPYATNDDSKEKISIGELWQQKMNGKGVFSFIEKEKDGVGMYQQLQRAIAAK
jgi:type III restriction enzyme